MRQRIHADLNRVSQLLTGLQNIVLCGHVFWRFIWSEEPTVNKVDHFLQKFYSQVQYLNMLC